MFNFRRSMNPPRRSTTTPPTSEIPSTPAQDPLPFPPGLYSPSHSHSNSGPQLRTPPSQKNDPYHHHLQQSQSKILGRRTGTKKYPPPIENKAQTPKRPAPSTPGLIGRVSSLFSSPSSSGGGNLTVPDTTIPEDATTSGENGRDNRSMAPPVKPKRKSLVNKFTKSSPKKSESVSTTPTKTKRVPPPLAMTSASPSSSSSFHPFRSITRSRSKLAQHLLGSFNEPEVDDTGDGNPSSFSSLHPSRSPRSARSPRSPRSPRTPRSPFFYTGESDAESDIRRPSGLGRRVSTSSLPPSPFGGTYPWEVRPNDQGSQQPPKPKMEGESSKAKDEVAKSEIQEQKSDEKGALKERFRFPSNKSVVNLTAEGSSPTTSNDGKNASQRKIGRPRAVSSPGLLLSIGRKVREKLERERELGRLKPQLSNVSKAKGETSPSIEETTPVQDIQSVPDAKNDQDTQDTQDALDTQGAPGMQNAQELQASQTTFDIHARTFSPAQELHRASVYSNDSEAGGSRERMMSFSLVHEFPEPPSTHTFTHPPRSSSESGPGAFIISPPPVPPVPPLPPSAFPLQQVPLDVVPLKRSSSSTMDSSVSATTSTTTTATSLGVEGAGSICNAVRARIESCSPREIMVVPAIKALATGSHTSNNALSTPCAFHPELASVHLPNPILRLALSFLPEKKDIAPLACVNKVCAEVVRSLLYDTLDLEALSINEEDENTSTVRVQKLLATLVKRKHLTALTTKFVCREWPEWFPSSPNDVSLEEEFEEDNEENAQEIELQNTFLASTLVLVLSRMTGLEELVLPSYHPFLFSDLTPETRWTRLKAVEFTNITLEDEEARDMFSWLDNMNDIEKLSFPQLVESGEVPTRTSNESISSVRSSKRSSTCSKRMSVPISNKRSSIGTGALYNPTLLNSVGLGSEELPRPQQRSLLLLEKYAHSWTFLPNLKVLHAPPTIVSLLAASSREEESSQGEERRPWRPLDKVTINIDMTLYTGLRPTSLVQSLHGIRWLGLKFGERVDRRTVEKVFVAVGAALGSNGLESLDIEFVGAWADESLYKIIDTVLPRYPDLRQLKMGFTKREVMASTNATTFELSPAEETQLSQWIRHCPDLVCVGLLSGSSWRRTSFV